MSKVENKSQVVKKEIFRIDCAHPLDLCNTIKSYKILAILSNNKIEKLALDVLERLNHFITIQEIKKLRPEFDLMRSMYSREEIPELTFEFLSNFDNESEDDNYFENMSIIEIKEGVKDLLNKGVLNLDPDGFLVFAPTGSMQ